MFLTIVVVDHNLGGKGSSSKGPFSCLKLAAGHSCIITHPPAVLTLYIKKPELDPIKQFEKVIKNF